MRGLPRDVAILPLVKHRDARGWLSEVFRRDRIDHDPCQWNVTASEPNVLRGMHVHVRHRDYLVVLQGRLSVGLFDIRPQSPTYHRPAMVTLAGDRLAALRVPVGVMHGFYSHEPTIYLYGVDAYYVAADELGCHWADPRLSLAWPCTAPALSERDARAGTLDDVEAQYREHAPPPAVVALRRPAAV